MPDSFGDIARVLRDYYDGLYRCDAALLETVFHPRALYATTSSGELLHYAMPAYMAVIRERTPPADAGDAYHYDIESIRFAGDDTAFAVLRCTMMCKHFTDFLSFVRDKGEWRIMAKVFHYDLAD